MKKRNFLAIALAAVLTFGLTSCKDDPENYDGLTMTAETEFDVEYIDHDATAAYPVHFKIGMLNGELVVTGLKSKPVITGFPGTMECDSEVSIADYGRCNSLAKIAPKKSDIPASTEFGKSKLIEKKHGYVIEAHGSAGFDETYNHNPQVHDPASMYVRFWVEDMLEDGSLHVRYEIYTPAVE